MSGLSHRVLNMKFMQKADAVDSQKKHQDNQKKIKDLSEWVSPQSEAVMAKARNAPKVDTIGYGGINSFVSDDDGDDFLEQKPSVRRTFGVPTADLEELKNIKEDPENKKAKNDQDRRTKKINQDNRAKNSKEPTPSKEPQTLDELWKSLSGKDSNTSKDSKDTKTSKDSNSKRSAEYNPQITKKRKRFN